jgi:ribonuclease III
MIEEKLPILMRKLGYKFVNLDLLRSAITHRSRGGTHNERLEFLGDSILNFTIAAELYRRFPKAREGDLTRMRALMVRGETLSLIAREFSLGEYLHLGLGEQKSGGSQRDSILADAVEAIIGAMFLDGGLEICQKRILEWFDARLQLLSPGGSEKDAKTKLQEFLQAKHLALPDYRIVETTGDPHDPTFKVECVSDVLEKPIYGTANTRRKAEQAAAEAALEFLKSKRK